MESYPIFPRTLKGWGRAVLLVIVYGLIYYLVGFPILWRTFESMELLYEVQCIAKNEVFVKGDVRFPFVIGDATVLPAFFTVWNARDTSIHDLYFWVVQKEDENTTKNSDLFLPVFVGESVLTRVVHVESLHPRERVSFRMNLLGTDRGSVSLRWSGSLFPSGEGLRGNQVKVEGECKYFENGKLLSDHYFFSHHDLAAVVMSLLERALLPPWSNGLVVVVALMVAVMLDLSDRSSRRLSMYSFISRALAVDVLLWALVFVLVGMTGWYWKGYRWVGIASTLFLVVIVGMLWVVWGYRPNGLWNNLVKGKSLKFLAVVGAVTFGGFATWELLGKVPNGEEIQPWMVAVGIFILLLDVIWALGVLWLWRWNLILDLKEEKDLWKQQTEDEKLVLSRWLTAWEKHLAFLEEKIRDLWLVSKGLPWCPGADRCINGFLVERVGEEDEGNDEEIVIGGFWHQEDDPHEDALAIATWLYPEVVGLHCQWLAEKYTRQQRDTVVSFPKWLHSFKRKLSRRQESQSSEEASPWKKFLDDLEAWGKGLKKVREAASLPEGEMPPSWPQQSEFQQLWHQLMKWGDGSFSVNDARYDIRRLQKFCSPRFLAFYDFAVRQREKYQNEQKKQEQEQEKEQGQEKEKEKDLSKPESDGK